MTAPHTPTAEASITTVEIMHSAPEGALSTADIARRIGHSPVLAHFIIDELGVPPDFPRIRRGYYWSEASFQLICKRWSAHMTKVAEEHTQVAA
jgi:uncharacterized protein Usg